MTPRTVLLIGAISLAAGWLVGTSTSSSQQEAPSAPQRSGPRALGSSASVAPFTRQLRERLDAQPPRTPTVGRNPFVFGGRRPTTLSRRNEEPITVLAPEPPPPLALEPQFRLSGIASSQQDGALLFTAIMTDNGALVFVKAGDRLGHGFSVVRVDESSVVIMDTAGVSQTLRLP